MPTTWSAPQCVSQRRPSSHPPSLQRRPSPCRASSSRHVPVGGAAKQPRSPQLGSHVLPATHSVNGPPTRAHVAPSGTRPTARSERSTRTGAQSAAAAESSASARVAASPDHRSDPRASADRIPRPSRKAVQASSRCVAQLAASIPPEPSSQPHRAHCSHTIDAMRPHTASASGSPRATSSSGDDSIGHGSLGGAHAMPTSTVSHDMTSVRTWRGAQGRCQRGVAHVYHPATSRPRLRLRRSALAVSRRARVPFWRMRETVTSRRSSRCKWLPAWRSSRRVGRRAGRTSFAAPWRPTPRPERARRSTRCDTSSASGAVRATSRRTPRTCAATASECRSAPRQRLVGGDLGTVITCGRRRSSRRRGLPSPRARWWCRRRTSWCDTPASRRIRSSSWCERSRAGRRFGSRGATSPCGDCSQSIGRSRCRSPTHVWADVRAALGPSGADVRRRLSCTAGTGGRSCRPCAGIRYRSVIARRDPAPTAGTGAAMVPAR